jgi:hypothetical protein
MKNINFSNELRQLTDALLRVQTKIGTVKQNADNPYFNSKFANLKTCWEYLRPFFNNENILIQQIVHETDNGVCVETLFIGYGTQLSGGKLPVPALKSDPQAYGSAVSYGKRYSLMQACGVASAKEDDDGEKARKAFEKESSSNKGYTLKSVQGSVIEYSVDEVQFLKVCRDYMGNPNADQSKGIFLANKEEIMAAKKKATKKSDIEAYEKLINLYQEKDESK